jgi:hypothetical protein
MSKMGSHDSFGYFKHKLWSKEGPGVRIHPNFLTCRWRVTYNWKALDKCYNFTLNLISIRGLHTKFQESQLWEFRKPHSGVPGQNDIWMLVPWPCTEYTIRGKVVASPKSRLWWVLWICVYSWFVRAPKCSNYTLTNLLFGLCRSMWVIELFVNLPSPIPELQHVALPLKCCERGGMPQLLLLPMSSPLDS